ncbi:hypothetical protein SAMN04488058_101299 [Deinococcus reticulitermitis]|uniref:Uncharacterized protein n=1 Tax=Deinococcus reticulitermitis TaxID=856736 RepID=A0A1H6SGL2_9DEIO|nr:hypothetical protein [Deinococcus reticulitermitis]SEI67098.1 hypothetical protein SAMN04488058_101299 [Deinococcus reticulitermitis]
MTQKNILAKPYYDGLTWHRGVGEEFDTSRLEGAVTEKLQAKGYLVTAQAYRASVNPEAAKVQETADAAQGELQSLYALFPGVTTTEGVKAAVQALRERVPSPSDLESVTRAKAFVTGLGQLYPEAKDPGALMDAAKGTLAQLKEAQAVKPEDVAALAEYRALVGELLPDGLAPTAVSALKAKGWVGKELLSRVPRAELDAVKGVGTEALKLLDTWAPYAGSATPPGAE